MITFSMLCGSVSPHHSISLVCRWSKWPSVVEGSCEYIE